MLISHIIQLLFFVANCPKTSFHLLMSSTFIPYLRVSVTHEIYMYQLTSSQMHKMAIEYSQR